MKHWITLLVTLCVLSLSACTYTVTIKKEAERVRVINWKPPDICQYLGNVKECFSGGRWLDSSGRDGARNKVINETHAMGGNAVKIGSYELGCFYDSCVCARGWAYICEDASNVDYQAGLGAYNSGDYATALKEFKPLAELGGATAQFNLGLMYYNGQGVPQDYAECYAWNNVAAVSGDESAKKN